MQICSNMIVIEGWNLACLMVERTINTMVMALWRYPEYLRNMTHLTMEQNHLTKGRKLNGKVNFKNVNNCARRDKC